MALALVGKDSASATILPFLARKCQCQSWSPIRYFGRYRIGWLRDGVLLSVSYREGRAGISSALISAGSLRLPLMTRVFSIFDG